jgi:hypothetical protein
VITHNVPINFVPAAFVGKFLPESFIQERKKDVSQLEHPSVA